jgi:hypothetical protein
LIACILFDTSFRQAEARHIGFFVTGFSWTLTQQTNFTDPFHFFAALVATSTTILVRISLAAGASVPTIRLIRLTASEVRGKGLTEKG